jgi:hypothetical protein
MRSPASSYDWNAARRLSRSIGMVPTARAAPPKIGTRKSSAFATNEYRGRYATSTSTSNQLTWFDA